ncbi:fat storage-inducing transmembrane protein 1-like [Sinocyclocheilus anshuiensis]|uniref:fat storage-inducing transmembrane protein 1-like n=1 Tax=Sinocyclocheilus anshuiensis TaxID=1608454 RepID=UPI0007BA5C34|nr:PREDICTED: fat storage-inducing transmembrane protein 1-like [Sinocyclocheilus anshuiensis]
MQWKFCPQQTKMDLCGLKEILYKIHNSVNKLLHWALEQFTDLTAGLLAHFLFRQHFHFLLSVLVMFGPALSLWVSKYSIFGNKNHYLYRLFLQSCWGWTCVLCGSFIFLLSYCISNSFIHSVCHLSRLLVAGTLWTLFRRLLSFLVDASGSCFEPLQSPTEVHRNPGALLDSDTGPLLLLREEKGKAACLKAGLQWQGCEVSDDILILSLCCLILAEEIAVFGPCMALGKTVGASLRIIFLLCVLLLGLWIFLILCLLAHFPLFPSQLVGGALGYLGWKGLYYKGWCVLKPGWCCLGKPKALLSDSTCNMGHGC